MGAGRKTFSYDVDTVQTTNYQFELAQKNLRSQLGGVIFLCNNHTLSECITGLIFGLPVSHWCYVQYIRIGMPLFLFNVHDRKLHGIFRAASDGDWEINPSGWTTPGSRTSYPCQVAVELYNECPTITEKQFRPAIASNYVEGEKFLLEVSKKQAADLCSLFRAAKEKLGGGSGLSVETLSQQLGAASLNPGSSTFAPSPAPIASAWGRGSAAAEEAPGGKQPGARAKTYAQIQEEEARAAEKAAREAKARARQQAGGPGTAAPQQFQQHPQQHQQQPAAAPDWAAQQRARAAVAAAAAPPAQQSAANGRPAVQPSQPPPALATAAPHEPSSAAPRQDRPGVEELSEELSALKLPSEVAMAERLQQHLSRFDDGLMKAQKERSKLMMANQEAATRLATMAGELKTLRQQARQQALPGAPPAASAAAGVVSGAAGEEVYLLGGNNGVDWLGSVLVHCPGSNSWREGPPMSLERGYGGSVSVGRCIYVMGGGNSSQWLQDLHCLDTTTGEWRQCASMSCVRGSLGSVAVGGRVYAIGGGQQGSYHDTVEVYDPSSNVWLSGPRMHSRRFSTSAVVDGGAIYACGGYNGERYLRTAERLDPREGTWKLLPDMHVKRGAHSCAAAHGKVFAVGGYDAAAFLPTVEVFDARAGRWDAQGGMAEGRAYGVASFVGGHLLVVGGMNGSEYLQRVERFDAGTSSWQAVLVPGGPLASLKRAFLSAAVLTP